MNGLYAETFFEKQQEIRIQKPLSISMGLNSISNYYYTTYLSISYTQAGSNEVGILLISSKFTDSSSVSYSPLMGIINRFQENSRFNQNSGKIFFSKFLFNSPFYVNASIGYLPSFNTFIQADVFSTKSLLLYDRFSFDFYKLPTAYVSPSFGVKLTFDNGIFLSVTGGPMYLLKNQTDIKMVHYSSEMSLSSFLRENMLLNILSYLDLNKNYGNKVEAYLDVSSGVSF